MLTNIVTISDLPTVNWKIIYSIARKASGTKGMCLYGDFDSLSVFAAADGLCYFNLL